MTVPDKEFLLARLETIQAELPRLRFPLPEGPVHGDARVQNLIISADGPVLIDFERFAWGQPPSYSGAGSPRLPPAARESSAPSHDPPGASCP